MLSNKKYALQKMMQKHTTIILLHSVEEKLAHIM